MFSTTEREKEILRMVEMHIVDRHGWVGICSLLINLYNSRRITWDEGAKLKHKIRSVLPANGYLEDTSGHATGLNNNTRKLMRRIWITKLLNYKGD